MFAQQMERLRQERQQQRERELRDEAVRGRLRENWLARRSSEQQQQVGVEEQRRVLLAQIQEQRRSQRQQEQLRSTRLKDQSRQALEQRQAEVPSPERAPQRNPRLEALRAARAEELRKQQQAEELRQQNLVRLKQQQKQQRQSAAGQNIRQSQLRAAKVDEIRQQKIDAAVASQRAQTLRQKELARGATIQSQRPLARVQRPLARATELRPSSLPTPPIPDDVPLPWLSTQGSFIVDDNGSPVYLRGVTVEGLDTVNPGPNQTLPDALALDDANLSALEDVWGINLIRIPFSSSSILHGNTALSADDLALGLDDVVAEASAAGCYVLLALRPAPGNTGLPSDEDYLCWRALAVRYKDEPTVLYELFASDRVLPPNWLGIAQAVIGTVRREHTASLLFVGSTNATADVSGFPMKFGTGDAIPNLVYTIRLSSALLNTANRQQLQALAQDYPLFVSQWSDGGGDFGRSTELASDLIERCAIGWAASSWNAEPRLVTNAAAHQFASTRWGLLVQRTLAQPVKPLLVPFS